MAKRHVPSPLARFERGPGPDDFRARVRLDSEGGHAPRSRCPADRRPVGGDSTHLGPDGWREVKGTPIRAPDLA